MNNQKIKKINTKKIEKAIEMIIEAIGENKKREGLLETPKRVAKMYEELFSGYSVDISRIFKVFTEDKHDEMIIVKDIPFYSICEHHFLPMYGYANVAYIPNNNKITGLSKLARIVDAISKRLQQQERITTQIAEEIMKYLQPKGVMVILKAEHLCMTMRGVKKPGTMAVTSCMKGIFLKDQRTRNEALHLLK
ncbi:MAG TPA: GTP cyclohydrolase I FolE [bacterium]|nr:GTP cyclohydrolase I FolE [bacterium]HOL47364.1 GTP cyclohydrolase I FolE [bacterium]HPQ18903.1 GTP cyclohydrolase I FolE [bacterium]